MPRSALAGGARDGASVEVDGWTVAAAYDDPAHEYAALRESAALVDWAFRGRLVATGADRVDFLQGMLSNDVRALAPGTGCAALLLTEQGKVVADCIVLAQADAIVLDARAGAIAGAREALERYIVADDVELAADGETHACALLGPRTDEALARVGMTPPPATPYAHDVRATAFGEVRIVRLPAPGGGGVLCLVPRERVAAWWGAWVEAGIATAGFSAFEALRIESGVPAYGVDVGPDTIALEAPYGAAISFGKGCYLGQEVVERVTARGHVNRKLVPLLVEAQDPQSVPHQGDAIVAGDKEIGRVTSAAWSWRAGRPVALAYVRREHVAPGTAVEVRTATGTLTAVVQAHE
ncbi:MAG TPA: glycine cleavage T C-terminal barrel domain-containing protein [Candidatus Binatia bacterium]|jgi:folate-binding protein YgfZ